MECPRAGAADDPLGPPDVDDHGVGVEDDAGEAAVAGQPLDGGAADGGGELQLAGRRADLAGEGLEGGGDLEVGPAGDPAGVESVVGQLDQGVGVALGLATVVVLPGFPSDTESPTMPRNPTPAQSEASRRNALKSTGPKAGNDLCYR